MARRAFFSLLVYQLHERQTIPAQGQCYGFAPHPRLSGRIDVNQAMIVEIGAWQSICAATIALKAGTTVGAVAVDGKVP
jgi:hypothetical protein